MRTAWREQLQQEKQKQLKLQRALSARQREGDSSAASAKTRIDELEAASRVLYYSYCARVSRALHSWAQPYTSNKHEFHLLYEYCTLFTVLCSLFTALSVVLMYYCTSGNLTSSAFKYVSDL